MKRFYLLILALITISGIQAQNTSLRENFTTGIDIFNDFVMDSPANIEFRAINPGVNIYGMYNYQIPKSSISLAIGLGLGMHNLHSNGILSDTNDVSFFTPFPDKVGTREVDYQRNKLQLTYLDIPAEIRFKSEGGFRVALGIKAGYLVSAHTKFKGDNLEGGRAIKVKESRLPNLEKWRFGPTFQIGYKFFNLTGFYSLSKVFEENMGPDIYPISVGISLRPF